MCLSQQDILLLAILHGAPVLTASAVTKSPTYTDSRVNLRLQALMDIAASLLPVLGSTTV